MNRTLKLFTLIELMIVVAIIAIIAVIAVPNLMDAQRNSKERAAIGNLKTVMSDQASYHSDNNDYATLVELSTTNKVNLTAASISGYVYSDLFVPTNDIFAVLSLPFTFGTTGKKNFICTSSGNIRYDTVASTALDDVVIAAQATLDIINSFEIAK
ncbi:MAG: hypothetical protein COA79_20590 [Planctomycetota bacterium]|nr:MAG: hypothetical protein COA79_20590 [Planctomycetota bacterium]